MKNLEMVIYCLIYPILTMTLFMIWLFQTPLTGETIGMAPVLVALVLFVVFCIDTILVIIFRNLIKNVRNKGLSLLIGFLMYEAILWFFNGEIALFGAFEKPLLVNLEMALSFSSIFALCVIATIMSLKQRMKYKKVLPTHK